MEILLPVTRKQFWVQAHLIVKKGGGSGSGHLYCELVDMEGGKQIAILRTTIWRPQYIAICKKLREAGVADPLADNSEISARCSVTFHDVYGLSLNIHDVDPTFGEAQIDRNRRLILERLQKEGILGKNKATVLPAASLSIGLITAEESAAFSDFKTTLTSSVESCNGLATADPKQWLPLTGGCRCTEALASS
jgi:exodeoxyribonuclease VII large subunit